MNAGNRLHAPAVTMRESNAIDGLCAAYIRGTEMGDRDCTLAGQLARHARAPKHLVADVTVDEPMQVFQLVQTGVRGRMHARDELELRFAEVRGDVRMSERGAERTRVRRHRKGSVRPDAQALFFDAASK